MCIMEWLLPIVQSGSRCPIFDDVDEIEDWNQRGIPTLPEVFVCIEELASSLLTTRHFNVPIKWWHCSPRPSYVAARVYDARLDRVEREFVDERMCMVYHVRLRGRTRRVLRQSLLLRALIG